MFALDWSQCGAVERIPGKVGGAWLFRGTRMPVATVFENLEVARRSKKSWTGSSFRENKSRPSWISLRDFLNFLLSARCLSSRRTADFPLANLFSRVAVHSGTSWAETTRSLFPQSKIRRISETNRSVSIELAGDNGGHTIS